MHAYKQSYNHFVPSTSIQRLQSELYCHANAQQDFIGKLLLTLRTTPLVYAATVVLHKDIITQMTNYESDPATTTINSDGQSNRVISNYR